MSGVLLLSILCSPLVTYTRVERIRSLLVNCSSLTCLAMPAWQPSLVLCGMDWLKVKPIHGHFSRQLLQLKLSIPINLYPLSADEVHGGELGPWSPRGHIAMNELTSMLSFAGIWHL